MAAALALVSMPAIGGNTAVLDRSAGVAEPTAGYQLLLQKGCTNCHGIAGPGRRQGPDLLRIARGKGSAELLAGMWNHVPQMVHGLSSGERLLSLSADELRELVGYFGYINYLGEAGDARRGQALLAEMSCLGCHDLRRRGKIGPPLIAPGRVASPPGLVTDLWNHYPGMSAALSQKGIAWFDWSGGDITDLSLYLSSITPLGPEPRLQAPGDPDQGAKVFVRLGCAQCHDSMGGAAWVALVRASNRRSAAENGAALLRHLPDISKAWGRARQPSRPLSAEDMADLLAYLSRAGVELSGGNAAKGEAVFVSKRCIGCHAMPGTKPGIGPNVVDMPAVADPYEAAALMIGHARGMKFATELKHVPWPQIQPEQLQDLYAFLSKVPRR
jgi:cytochrome c2